MKRLTLKMIIAALALALTIVQPAQAQQIKAEDFSTATGLCTLDDRTVINNFLGSASQNTAGSVLTITDTPIFQTRGRRPFSTQTSIPPLTKLTCHHVAGDKILVTSNGATPYCGWIDGDDVSGGTMTASVAAIVGGSDYCGPIVPMSIGEFCAALDALGQSSLECSNVSIRRSVFDAKFIINNTGLAAQSSTANLSPIEIPIYAEAMDTQPNGSVTVFNVMLIRDVANGPDGTTRYLLLTGDEPVGWVNAEAGQVWYSRLATFFAADNQKPVLSQMPHSRRAKPIAGAPPKLDEMLNGDTEYQRYPVLEDNRVSPSKNKNHKPNLRISFIGVFCDGADEGLCTKTGGELPNEIFDTLSKTDVLFLIDGTKSMKDYFSIVSDSVKTLSRKFVGDPQMRFGVAMYGDYLDPARTDLGDPMQFRFPVPLAPLTRGTEFDNLASENLYIADPMSDKMEPTNGALYEAVTTTAWRGVPTWIIHIADHGDRNPPTEKLLEVMKKNSIFYVPIPVRGEAVLPESDLFFEHSNIIRKQHVTDEGAQLTVAVEKTYNDLVDDPAAERKAISRALLAAMQNGEDLRKEALKLAYDQQSQTKGTGSNSSLPNGYANVFEAGVEIYLKAFKNNLGTNDITRRTIATEGYVETVPVGEPETNWDYFASLPPNAAHELLEALNGACRAVGDGDSSEIIVQSTIKIMSVLTGDPIQEGEDFYDYWRNRANLPLATQTLFRANDLREMLTDFLNGNDLQRILAHKKEFCRSAVLVGLMVSTERLDKPFEFDENGNRGDLVWRRDSENYTYRNASEHNWLYIDEFGRRVYFLPLDFLPKNTVE